MLFEDLLYLPESSVFLFPFGQKQGKRSNLKFFYQTEESILYKTSGVRYANY